VARGPSSGFLGTKRADTAQAPPHRSALSLLPLDLSPPRRKVDVPPPQAHHHGDRSGRELRRLPQPYRHPYNNADWRTTLPILRCKSRKEESALVKQN